MVELRSPKPSMGVRIPLPLPCETEKVQMDFFLFHNDICSDEQVILLRNEIHFMNDIAN